VWRHDWMGWSGGWYALESGGWELTILGIRNYSYSATVTTPLTGDLTVGVRLSEARASIYRHPREKDSWLVFHWRSWTELQEAEAEVKARNEARAVGFA